MSGSETENVIDIGLVEDVEVTAPADYTALEPSAGDRMVMATLAAILAFMLSKNSPNRQAWLMLGAALGAFVLPKVFGAFRMADGSERWAVVNPFGSHGAEPTWWLT